MMETIERELQKGLGITMYADSDVQCDLMKRMVRYIGEYRRFYCTFLQKHADYSFTAGIQTIWNNSVRQRLRARKKCGTGNCSA